MATIQEQLEHKAPEALSATMADAVEALTGDIGVASATRSAEDFIACNQRIKDDMAAKAAFLRNCKKEEFATFRPFQAGGVVGVMTDTETGKEKVVRLDGNPLFDDAYTAEVAVRCLAIGVRDGGDLKSADSYLQSAAGKRAASEDKAFTDAMIARKGEVAAKVNTESRKLNS